MIIAEIGKETSGSQNALYKRRNQFCYQTSIRQSEPPSQTRRSQDVRVASVQRQEQPHSAYRQCYPQSPDFVCQFPRLTISCPWVEGVASSILNWLSHLGLTKLANCAVHQEIIKRFKSLSHRWLQLGTKNPAKLPLVTGRQGRGLP